MDANFADLFKTEVTVTSVLSMLVFFGGFFVCWMNRLLSSRLLVVAIGFAGLFISTALSLLVVQDGVTGGWGTFYMMISSALYLVSYLLIVAGLGSALVEIRRKIALSLEPTHGRS